MWSLGAGLLQNFIDHEKSGLFLHATKLKTKTRQLGFREKTSLKIKTHTEIVIFSVRIFNSFPSLSSLQHP